MKDLFKCENGRREGWTNDAHEISRELEEAIRPIVEKYANDGYKIRELQYIVNDVAMHVSLINLICSPTESEDSEKNSNE